MLSNAFGQFNASGRAFSITDHRTPMPWVNVMGNGRLGVVVSQNGGGFTWFDNSQLNVLTRWEMDLIRDDHGKYLYIADLESKDVWSLAPAPCQPSYHHYQCEHTLGRTTFSTAHKGISAEWTIGVAADDAAELWKIKITNTTSATRKLRVASFFEWCCGVAPDTKREFHRLFFTTKHDAQRHAVVVRKNMWDAPAKNDLAATEKEKRHWNVNWPYVAAHAVAGVKFSKDLAIADKAMFMGRYTSPANPAAMTATSIPAATARNNFGRFSDASAALGGDLELAPGQSVTVVYTLAIAADEAGVLALVDKYNSVAAVDRGLTSSDELWNRMTGPSQVQSSMPDFDLLNSHWLPYQAISGRLWGRTGYYQQSGAFGFRDQLQDSQVWLPRDPARMRAQILQHAAHQFADGSVYHWWHPLAEFGLRTACSDDYLWLPYLTAAYLKDTGDWSILREIAPFVDDAKGATILDHAKRSIARSLARQSPRGLPLIGSCDWNDGLSSMGIDGKGESVWLAQWLCVVLEEFAIVLERSGDDRVLASAYRDARSRLAEAINTHAWDAESGGQWYRAATRDDGRWIGTATNTEGRIFLNTQTWAILSDTAPIDREDACWASVKQHLLQFMGPLLSLPAYTEPDTTIGYITRYAPGLRENGGVYMHAATWALAAAAKRRDVHAVEKIWRSISPPLRGQDAAAYVAEPYVTPGNVDGPDSSTPGKAGWTWYTGSAAWLNKVSLDWILGIRATWEGLAIDPCPPAALGEVTATRVWRGKQIRVRFNAAEFNASVSPSITVNGRPLSGGVIRPEDVEGKTDVHVEVSWGVQVRSRPVQNGVATVQRHSF